MEDAIISFLTAHPSLQIAMTLIMVLRAVFKPLMTVLESGVNASGNAKAIATLQSAEASKLYKGLVFVVDYLTSLKLPVVQAATTSAPDSSTPASGTPSK